MPGSVHRGASLLRQEVTAWEAGRNTQQVRVNWRFTTQDARIQLKRLYPILEQECSEESLSVQQATNQHSHACGDRLLASLAKAAASRQVRAQFL